MAWNDQTPFMIGCNYWGSRQGTEMWRRFDPDSIDEDFAALAENGCRVLRIFPNWRDFQPIMTIDGYAGDVTAYRMNDGSPDGAPLTNPCGLDETMLERMACVCRLAEKHGLRLVVSIVTGWMSGRLFVPEAMKGKNVITDPEALRWESRMARGLAAYLKDEKAIAAWDLGNECNCMGRVETAHQAYLWTLTIASAIRAGDPSRPVLSGMHDLAADSEGCWTIHDQGELTDMMTPHPYSASIGADVSPATSYRALVLPTAQMVFYADLSGKPAMIEEQGTLNNIYCTPEDAAFAAEVNLASCWANGGRGHLWWCAHDQKNLDFAPYWLSMRELGWLDQDRRPKPVAVATHRFARTLDALGGACVMERQRDAVCVLTRGQNMWHTAAMTYLLGKQSGLELSFARHDMPIPTARIYMLPCISGWTTLYKSTWNELLRRVREEGAVLYASFSGGVLEQFEEVFRLRSRGQYKSGAQEQLQMEDGNAFAFDAAEGGLYVEPNGADVLARTEAGRPVFTRAAYGRGQVFFLTFGMEQMLWRQSTAFEGGCRCVPIYRALLKAAGVRHAIRSENPMLGVSRGKVNGEAYTIIVNYAREAQPLSLVMEPGVQPRCLIGRLDAPLPEGGYTIIRS